MIWCARGSEPGDVDVQFLAIATRALDNLLHQGFDELINEVWEYESQAAAPAARPRRPPGATAALRADPAGPRGQRLLCDDTLPTPERVAGLLVLLYAQTASSIRRLSTDRVTRDGDQVLLRLGTRPIRLPAPLDALVLDLVASRARTPCSATTATGSSPGARQAS